MVGLVLTALLAVPPSAQSLGELVRQQKAQQRPRAQSDRIFTEDNMPGARGSHTPGSGQAEKLAPFVPSPMAVVRTMLSLAGIRPGEKIYDLGCGDGRIIIMAAQEFGAHAVGVELDEALYKETSARIRKLGLFGEVEVIHGDMLKVDLSPADVVTLYLTPEGNPKIRPNLEKYLKKGARVVSHEYPIPDWKADLVKTVPGGGFEHRIYLYRR